MRTVTAAELSEQIEQILRRVRDEGESVEIVERGQVAARLTPSERYRPRPDAAEEDALWAEVARLAAEREVHPGQQPGGSKPTRAERDVIWDERDRLAAAIGAEWPKGVTSAEAIAKDRREL